MENIDINELIKILKTDNKSEKIKIGNFSIWDLPNSYSFKEKILRIDQEKGTINSVFSKENNLNTFKFILENCEDMEFILKCLKNPRYKIKTEFNIYESNYCGENLYDILKNYKNVCVFDGLNITF